MDEQRCVTQPEPAAETHMPSLAESKRQSKCNAVTGIKAIVFLQGVLFIFLTQRGDSRNVVAHCVTSGKFLLMLLFQQVIYLFWYLFYMFVSQTFFFLLIIMFFRCVPLTSASRTHI